MYKKLIKLNKRKSVVYKWHTVMHCGVFFYQRDSWMEAPLDLIPTITRKEIRDAQKAENQEDEKVMVDQVSVCV